MDKRRADPHVCGRCAEVGPTCCRLTPGQEELCFPVSDLEKGRILEVAPDAGGFVLAPNSAAFLDNMMRLFPSERRMVRSLFPERKFHTRLATGRDGSCRFLRQGGCSLPTESRPYYCRLFPFWMSEGRLVTFDCRDCLAQRECKSVGRLLEALNSSTALLRDLHGRLRLAWGFPPQQGMQRVERSF